MTTDKLRTRDFDMIWTSGSGIDPDPPLYNDFYTGASNNFGYSNPEMDAALIAGRTSTDLEVRKKAYITVARIWVNDVPIVPVYRSVSQQSVSKDVRGFEVYDLGYMTFSDLWIQQ